MRITFRLSLELSGESAVRVIVSGIVVHVCTMEKNHFSRKNSNEDKEAYVSIVDNQISKPHQYLGY